MKLCYVASGVADHVEKWVHWFAERGHEVHLISPPYDSPFRAFRSDIKVYPLKRLMPGSYRSSRLWNMPYWVKQARSIMKEIQPDLVEGQYIGIHGAIAALAGYRPLILQAWGSDILLDSKNWPNSMLVKYCLKKADMLFCDSEAVKNGLRGLGTDMGKVRKMYNGVDTKLFSPDQRVRRQIIISTRYLRPIYQVETTIKAMPYVRDHFPEARLLIVGDGEERVRLEQLVEYMWGMNAEAVTFVGNASQEQVRDYLNIAQVYVSTSKSDSSSLCLQEAMACELPAVVSSLDANKEWVEDGVSGYLAPVGDEKAVADGIKQLLGDKEERERFGRIGRLAIVERADLNDNMEKVEGYYRELIGDQQVKRRSDGEVSIV